MLPGCGPDRLELVARALERRKAAGTTLVLASHSPTLVAHLADERLELDEASALAER